MRPATANVRIMMNLRILVKLLGEMDFDCSRNSPAELRLLDSGLTWRKTQKACSKQNAAILPVFACSAASSGEAGVQSIVRQ